MPAFVTHGGVADKDDDAYRRDDRRSFSIATIFALPKATVRMFAGILM